MYKGNFRILIFIDLLATALGGSIILMMVLSVNQSSASSPPAGRPRAFLFYKAVVSDPGAKFKVIVKKPGGEWITSKGSELMDSLATFSIGQSTNPKAAGIFAWGPVLELDTAGSVLCSAYNVYSAIREPGQWIIGLYYYSHKSIENEGLDQEKALKTLVEVKHSYKTNGMDEDTSVADKISIGNYSYIYVNVDPIK